MRAVCTLFFLSAEAKAARQCVRPTRSGRGNLGKARGREVPARDSGRESWEAARPRAREEAWRPADRNCTGGRPTAAAREVSRDRRPNGRFRRRLGKRSHSEPQGRTTVPEKDAPPPQYLVTSERKRLRLAAGTTRKVRKSRSGLLRGRKRNASHGSIPANSGATVKALGWGKATRPCTESSGAPSNGVHPAVDVECAGRGRPAAPRETAADCNLLSGQSAPGLPKYPKESCRRGSSRVSGDAGPGASEGTAAHGEGVTPVSRRARAGGTLKRAKSNDGNRARPRGRDPTATHSLPVYLVNCTMPVRPSGRSAVGIYNGPRADRRASRWPRFRPMYTPGTSRG